MSKIRRWNSTLSVDLEKARAFERRGRQELPRYAELESKTPLPPTNPERKARLFIRNYNSAEYRAFVVARGCVVPGCHGAEIHAAHVRSKGSGGDWRSLVGLCAEHHRLHHDLLTARFDARFGVDLEALAAAYASRWLALGGATPDADVPDPDPPTAA